MCCRCVANRRCRFKTATAGFRGRIITSRKDLWKGGPFKPLTEGMAKTGGRNHHGVITARHRGGGHRKVCWAGSIRAACAHPPRGAAPRCSSKPCCHQGLSHLIMPALASTPLPPRQVYRLIDFARPTGTKAAVVERLEYDPNRSAHIALVKHKEVDPTAALREQYRWGQRLASPQGRLGSGAGAVLALAEARNGQGWELDVHNLSRLPALQLLPGTTGGEGG